MEERKFKIGDTIVFKSFDELEDGNYHYGGEDMGGVIGKTKRLIYDYEKKTVLIEFTHPYTYALTDYTMLESELREYFPSGLNMSIKEKKKSLNFGY